MDNLLSLLPENATVFKVFNGKDPKEGELRVRNCKQGRDVAMYKAGLDATGWDYAAFVNDDMQHIDPGFWEATGDIVGCPNLSTWVDYDKCDDKARAHHEKRGRELLFIRTAAFKMGAELFNRLWSESQGVANAFEKATLSTGADPNVLPPDWLIDSNIARYL